MKQRVFPALMRSRLLAWPRRQMARIQERAVVFRRGATVYYHDAHRAAIFDLVRRVRAERALGLEDYEAVQLYTLVDRSAKIAGDLAEIGVFHGASAKLICAAKGERPLHLFDTFTGMPSPGLMDEGFHEGQFTVSLESVQAYLAAYSGISYYKGLFPATADRLRERRFSFVHFDADLYEPARACCELFYPRLSPGGVLLIHDYPDARGVVQAIDEFFADRPEPVLQLPGRQAVVIKL